MLMTLLRTSPLPTFTMEPTESINAALCILSVHCPHVASVVQAHLEPTFPCNRCPDVNDGVGFFQ